MNIWDFCERKLEGAKRYAQELIYASIRYTSYTSSTATGEDDRVGGHLSGDDNRVRRMGTWGVRSVPPAGVDTVVVRAGGGPTNGVVIGCESRAYGPGDLDDGEVAVYNKVDGCVVRFWSDGHITIDAPSGELVNIQSGSDGIARLNDTTKAATAMATWMGKVETAINLLSPGAVATLSTTFATTSIGVINTASTKAKCG